MRVVPSQGRHGERREYQPPPAVKALIRQRLLQRSFEQFRTTAAVGEPMTTAMMMFVEDYNRHLGTCDHVDGVEQITQESLEAALRLPKSKVAEACELVSPTVSPREYKASEPPAYVAPDWDLLEALLRVAEHKLKGVVTKELAEQIDQVMASWRPVADERPDLAARLDRIKAAADLLRPSVHQ